MNYHSDEWIQDKVSYRHEQMKQRLPETEIAFTFYKGSANYNLDTENSDIDTISVIIPSLDDLISEKKNDTDIVFSDGIGTVADIRSYGSRLLKQCRNEMESLYTFYCVVEPPYEDLFNTLIRNSKNIEKNRKVSSLYVSLAMADGFEKKFKKSLENNDGSYDKKALSNYIREISFCSNLLEGKSYFESMIANDAVIYGIKNGALPLSGASQTYEIYSYLKNDIRKQEFPQSWTLFNEEAAAVVSNFVRKCIRNKIFKDE